MNKENLLKLAEHLENNVSRKEFDMNDYRNDNFINIDDCGTVGCALGHAPFINGLSPVLSDYARYGLNWSSYGERITGLDSLSEEWAWCFYGTWSLIDNTPKGAALRIKELVNNGLPKDAEGQLYRLVPYMFEDMI